MSMAGATSAPLAIGPPDALLAREADLRDGGSYRMRDAAAALGVPEAALLEARRSTGAARRLQAETPGDYGRLLAALTVVGEVMALTRNESCVHEKHGVFAAPEIEGAMGQVVGEIDLRVFLRHWRYGYVLDEDTASGPRQSLQIFDAHGIAVHKIFATAATDAEAFSRLAEASSAPDATPAQFFPEPAPEAERPDAEIDREGLLAGWDALAHSHEFLSLLRRFGVGRAQAMRLGGPTRARPVDASAVELVLEGAASAALPIMVFVGNRGCVQIHSGPVERIKRMGSWLNVLDPRFNLHLREDRISAAYVVRKPSLRGDIHSLELFDAGGECFCQIFGARPPGGTERADWRELVTGLPGAVPC